MKKSYPNVNGNASPPTYTLFLPNFSFLSVTTSNVVFLRNGNL